MWISHQNSFQTINKPFNNAVIIRKTQDKDKAKTRASTWNGIAFHLTVDTNNLCKHSNKQFVHVITHSIYALSISQTFTVTPYWSSTIRDGQCQSKHSWWLLYLQPWQQVYAMRDVLVLEHPNREINYLFTSMDLLHLSFLMCFQYISHQYCHVL